MNVTDVLNEPRVGRHSIKRIRIMHCDFNELTYWKKRHMHLKEFPLDICKHSHASGWIGLGRGCVEAGSAINVVKCLPLKEPAAAQLRTRWGTRGSAAAGTKARLRNLNAFGSRPRCWERCCYHAARWALF